MHGEDDPSGRLDRQNGMVVPVMVQMETLLNLLQKP